MVPVMGHGLLKMPMELRLMELLEPVMGPRLLELLPLVVQVMGHGVLKLMVLVMELGLMELLVPGMELKMLELLVPVMGLRLVMLLVPVMKLLELLVPIMELPRMELVVPGIRNLPPAQVEGRTVQLRQGRFLPQVTEPRQPEAPRQQQQLRYPKGSVHSIPAVNGIGRTLPSQAGGSPKSAKGNPTVNGHGGGASNGSTATKVDLSSLYEQCKNTDF